MKHEAVSSQGGQEGILPSSRPPSHMCDLYIIVIIITIITTTTILDRASLSVCVQVCTPVSLRAKASGLAVTLHLSLNMELS